MARRTISLKDQLAAANLEIARLRRLLTTRWPGTARDGTPAWQIVERLGEWLQELDTLDWPLTGRGPATGTIGRSGHTDPTGEAAANREKGWTPARESTRLSDRIQRTILESRNDTLGPPPTPRTRQPACGACDRDHAHTWTVCPWTGQLLESSKNPQEKASR